MKRTLTLVAGLITAVVMMAGNVTKEQARQQAREFLNQHRPAAQAQSVRMAAQRQLPVSVAADATAYYVFNVGSDQGFVIVSGSDATESILGYSDHGSFDADRLPANMRWWLDSYARQIAAASQQPAAAAATARRVPTHDAVEPLVQSTWNQDKPYNLLCPIVNDSLAPTGCVATAMAQIIAYHQYPAQVPDIPAYTFTYKDVPYTLDALEGGTIDWANILTSYKDTINTTDAQKMAVAKLMQWVGQSVRMDYGARESGAYDDNVVPALLDYFSYDKGLRMAKRAGYSAEVWDSLIYRELAAGRPVYYTGSASEGGHAFVCDGYDGNGMYHINWGWGGEKNGFFKLSVLNPYGGGIGAAGSDDGYAIDQGVIIGIQPPTTDSTPHVAIEMSEFELDKGTTVMATYVNRDIETHTVDYGFSLLDAAKNELSKYTLSAELAYQQSVSAVMEVTNLKLADGTYYLYPYYALKGQESLNYDPTSFAAITVSGGTYKVTMHPAYKLKLNSMSLVTEAVADETTVLKVSVTNQGEEYNGPYFLFGVPLDPFSGDFIGLRGLVVKTNVVIEGGETEETSLYFKLKTPGTWRLWLALDTDFENVIGNIDIEVSDKTTAVTGPTATGASASSADWYTLQGARLTTSPTAPGIYLHNGRKVVVR